jgi:hypothetical protein
MQYILFLEMVVGRRLGVFEMLEEFIIGKKNISGS